MLNQIENLLKSFNLDFTINDDMLTVYRNGVLKTFKIPKNLVDLEILLNLFCVYSPASTKELKERFPFFFKKLEPGDRICVSKFGYTESMYQIVTFKEISDQKIVGYKSNEEKELYFDFYQHFDGENHPSSNFWFNACQNHITYALMENLLDKHIQKYIPKN